QPKGSLNSQFTIHNSELLNGRYVLAADDRIHFEISKYDKSRPLVIDPVLSYSTYLGGSGLVIGYGIAVDSSGSAYVTGLAESVDFPITNGLEGDTTRLGDVAFVTKFNAAGDGVVYSTYLS